MIEGGCEAIGLERIGCNVKQLDAIGMVCVKTKRE